MTTDNYSSYSFALNERRFVYTYTCNSNLLYLWLLLEIIFFITVTILLIIMLYYNWKAMVTKAKDLKWILLSMNNLILGFALILPLTNTIQNDDDVCSIYTITVMFTTAGNVLALVLPEFPKLQIPLCCKKRKYSRFNDMRYSQFDFSNRTNVEKSPRENIRGDLNVLVGQS